jgi:hypothetical protein
MLKKVLIGVGAVVLLFVVVVATRPGPFHIERSVVMAAPPASAFAQVNDFHAWAAWSPYEKLDAQLTKTYGGAPSGAGATYAWSGDKAGQGTMTLQASEPPSRIVIKLEFTRPMTATNTATFTFAKVAEGTKVTWAMEGVNGFAGKAFSLFVDMDTMIGKDFEAGLVNMKGLLEGAKGSPAAGSAAQ